jgi:hypothetical protein
MALPPHSRTSTAVEAVLHDHPTFLVLSNEASLIQSRQTSTLLLKMLVAKELLSCLYNYGCSRPNSSVNQYFQALTKLIRKILHNRLMVHATLMNTK